LLNPLLGLGIGDGRSAFKDKRPGREHHCLGYLEGAHPEPGVWSGRKGRAGMNRGAKPFVLRSDGIEGFSSGDSHGPR